MLNFKPSFHFQKEICGYSAFGKKKMISFANIKLKHIGLYNLSIRTITYYDE